MKRLRQVLGFAIKAWLSALVASATSAVIVATSFIGYVFITSEASSGILDGIGSFLIMYLPAIVFAAALSFIVSIPITLLGTALWFLSLRLQLAGAWLTWAAAGSAVGPLALLVRGFSIHDSAALFSLFALAGAAGGLAYKKAMSVLHEPEPRSSGAILGRGRGGSGGRKRR